MGSVVLEMPGQVPREIVAFGGDDQRQAVTACLSPVEVAVPDEDSPPEAEARLNSPEPGPDSDIGQLLDGSWVVTGQVLRRRRCPELRYAPQVCQMIATAFLGGLISADRSLHAGRVPLRGHRTSPPVARAPGELLLPSQSAVSALLRMAGKMFRPKGTDVEVTRVTFQLWPPRIPRESSRKPAVQRR